MSGQWATVIVASIAVVVNIGTSYLVLRSASKRDRRERERFERERAVGAVAEVISAGAGFRDAASGFIVRMHAVEQMAASPQVHPMVGADGKGMMDHWENVVVPATAALQTSVTKAYLAINDESVTANLVPVLDGILAWSGVLLERDELGSEGLAELQEQVRSAVSEFQGGAMRVYRPHRPLLPSRAKQTG